MVSLNNLLKNFVRHNLKKLETQTEQKNKHFFENVLWEVCHFLDIIKDFQEWVAKAKRYADHRIIKKFFSQKNSFGLTATLLAELGNDQIIDSKETHHFKKLSKLRRVFFALGENKTQQKKKKSERTCTKAWKKGSSDYFPP
ncbi:hypothetical protein RFI_16426 [Reticulomyxa filosa]|uniref:Uncharacterized protein n=1 Tax=Reticulomyxa filosa TaxID=46433 RepID=X6N435_RETFI|nr:hypothetical protein RFI_16426 [Reticulomyxa filosa]|eukprot:ETO20791.1 hypothetical protein RFI_16426 [Reticulomyxa filosa]